MARLGLAQAAWALSVALCLAGTGAARAEMRVGITMSASGPGSALGQPQMKAVATLPKTIAGEPVTYLALDDDSDATKGTQNARKLIQDGKVDVLI
ncbi:MAG: ABC transporter substrate-binding protein, partial [Methylobacteriaceae bacterium]|nr:ABC transporter substrate-binding protein [Methylobacteriaceae bacterium]